LALFNGSELATSNESPVNLYNFPKTAEEMGMLVMQRYFRKKKQHEAAAKDSTYKKALEKALENPEDLKDWFINYLSKHKDELLKNYPNGVSIKRLLDNAVFPCIGEIVTFDVPSDSTVKERIESGNLSDVEKFINQHLEEFLDQVSKMYLNHYHEFHKKPGILPHNNRIIYISEFQGRSETIDGRHITLNQLLKWLVNGLAAYFSAQKLDTIHYDLREINDCVRRRHDLLADIVEQWKKAGSFAYCSVFIRNPLLGGWDELVETESLINKLIDSMLPDKPESVTAEVSFPNFVDFPKLRDQLMIHMQRLAVNGQVNKLLEEKMFNNEPISNFKKQYDQASENIFANKRKRYAGSLMEMLTR